MTLNEALTVAGLNERGKASDNEVITIDNDLRTVIIPEEITLLGVESDDKVRELSFKMPRFYKDLDLSEFEVRINYENSSGLGDKYAVNDKTVTNDCITFSWLIGRNACKYKGPTFFNVCLRKVDNAGLVEKEFNTTIASLPVLEGLETTENIIQENADIIEQILSEEKGLVATVTSAAQEAKNQTLLAEYATDAANLAATKCENLAKSIMTTTDSKTGVTYTVGIENGVMFLEPI